MSEVWVARPHEAGEVTRLLIAFRDWLGESAPDEEAFAASVTLLCADSATEFLLGKMDGGAAPCGVCQLRFRHSVWTTTPDCWLEDLYVEPAGRGQGLGRSIVTLAFKRASARGATRIELDTNEQNRGAIALYESLGFSASSKSHGPLQGRDLFMGRHLP